MSAPSSFTESRRHRVLWATMKFLDDTAPEGPVSPPFDGVDFARYHGARVALHKAVDRKRLIWEAQAADLFADYFRREREAVVRAVRNESEVDPVLSALEPALKDAYDAAFTDVATAYARWTRAHLVTKAEPSRDTLDTEARRYLRSFSAKRVKDVSAATRRRLRDLLAAGLDEGESVRQIARRIDKLYLDEIIPGRSLVIARTEVGSASQYAGLAAAKDAGVPMTKTWNTNIDGRERDTHRAADGQTVPLDGVFTVGGEELEHPGDPEGSPEEVIQCRCFLTYTVK
jgi:hypothetical protein